MKTVLKYFIQVKMLLPFITNDSDPILLCNGYSSLISQEDKAYKVCFSKNYFMSMFSYISNDNSCRTL